jgi:hypothetical protein
MYFADIAFWINEKCKTNDTISFIFTTGKRCKMGYKLQLFFLKKKTAMTFVAEIVLHENANGKI